MSDKEPIIIPPGADEGKNNDEKDSFFANLLNNPAVSLILMILGIIYFLNPTGGIVELIPDNIPVIGNLDEAGAAFLVWNGIKNLTKNSKEKKEAQEKSNQNNV